MTRAGGGIAAMIERQMRNWELAREQRRRKPAPPPAEEERILFYVTISREAGCGVDAIAEQLVQRTGFQKFDHEILDYMVGRDDVRRKLFETLDDQTVSWIEDVCNSLAIGPAVDETEYFNRLTHAMLAICHNTHAIIIGRGGNAVLPPERGLSVRLVAPESDRLERFAAARGLDPKAAQRDMDRITQSRSQFLEDHFGKHVYDPRRYDLTVNTARFAAGAIADLIVAALKAKAGPTLTVPQRPA